MTAANFPRALALVLQNEGGYSCNSADPGGATNRGITRATLARWRGHPVSKADVRSLGRAEAAAIYRARYWDAVRGDDLPGGIDLAVFDYAVNSGPGRAAKCLQRCVGVRADGVIGPVTLHAVAAQHPVALINAYSKRRLSFLERLRTWRIFGRGWKARVKRVQQAALALA